MEKIGLQDCWAKTDRDGNPALGVWEHCLNVGSVAAALFSRLPDPLRPFAIHGLITLAAGHDIGKIAAGFQVKCRSHVASLDLTAKELRNWIEADGNHAKISQAILGKLAFLGDNTLAQWTIPAGGHHGCFPEPSRARPNIPTEFVLPEFESAREELLEKLISHFGPLPTLACFNKDHLLWATGFITLADWLGSNEDLYPLAKTPANWRAEPDLTKSAETARSAIEALKLGSGKPVGGQTFGDLFQSVDGNNFNPNSLQRTLIAAATAPGLYIVEAPMGEGKTEAALAAAYQLWRLGHHHGLYFGLPTQLTSERIHVRLQAFLDRAITDDGAKLTLVHGSAWLKDDQRILDVSPTARDPDPDKAEPGALDARRWFTSRRRPLLAPFGVGTIDQALMATMPLKHAGLRLFALSGKVIVLDEVHSFDPYTSELIDALVARLLNLGCSVIILSATLTNQRRQDLLKKAGATEVVQADVYPLLSVAHCGDETAHSIRFEADPKMYRTVTIETRDPDSDEVFFDAVAAAEVGAAVLIVRNTVALAQQTYEQLKSICREGVEVGLLHSRFTPQDREAIEKNWLGRFGKNCSDRGRCILVATQIVEQSIDIDADLLFSDLAPSDLLIQRIGRLHRHKENEALRPASTATPKLILIDPLTGCESEEKNIAEKLAPHSFIYPPYSLLRTSARWRELSGSIRIPEALAFGALHRFPHPRGDEPDSG
jgi:CRISPR-associated endonuclease/helicase Cas3